MSIDKALQAVPGEPSRVRPESFVGEDFVAEADDDGGLTFTFGAEEGEEAEELVAHDDNLAEHMAENELTSLSTDLIAQYKADRDSREDWEKTYIKGLDLLGLKFEERSKPWDGACGVFHPMLSEAVVRFQAQSIQEIFPATGPCKTKLVGKTNSDLEKQGKRVSRYMNYLATTQMKEYRAETEKLLFSLPIAGSAFRKVYYDPGLKRPASMFVPAEDFVVSYGASDLSTCGRYTHLMKKTPNEVRKLQVSGWYIDEELDDPTPVSDDDIKKKYDKLTGHKETYDLDGRHTLLEMHVEIDLAGFEDKDAAGEHTRIELPYVVTLDYYSGTILAVRRNWHEENENKDHREFFAHYMYLPGLGFYGFGLVHMIGGLTQSATSILRQLVDAGTLSNLPGGLKSRGLKIKGDDSPIEPGEFRDVDVPSGAIRDNITFLPYKEPSNVLYMLLGDLVQEGKRFASAADLKASDMNGEAPVGTTLALLEREMKVMSAIQARLHAAMGKELEMLSEVVKDFGPDEYPYEEDDGATLKEDFDGRVDIIPVSDPNAGTMAQRIMQYQAALQLSAGAPQIYNMPLLHRQMLEVLGIQDAEKIVPTDDDHKPKDPVSENMALITGEPVKAFLYQDHEAHITTHMAAAQNPEIQEMMKQNPNAKAVMAAMAAHVSEHLAFAYRAKVEKELGVELPGPEEVLPEDIELRLSRIVSVAAAQVTGKAQRMKKAEEDAKKQEDPIVIQAEKEHALEEKKALAKAKHDFEKLADDREKVKSHERIESAKIGAKVAADQLHGKTEADKITSKERLDGVKVGMEMAQSFIEDKPNE